MQNILVADDLEIICTGLTYLIDHQNTNWRVTAHTHNGTDTFIAVEQGNIDIVIMELDMPGENGLTTLQRLHDNFPKVPVIVLSTHEERECLTRCFQHGAAAYVLKRSGNAEIINALQHVNRQALYIDANLPLCATERQALTDDCAMGNLTGLSDHCPYERLSRREREVFPLITMGYANREIAQRLCISTKTVEAHKASIMRKLALSCHVELVRFAVHHHLVTI